MGRYPAHRCDLEVRQGGVGVARVVVRVDVDGLRRTAQPEPPPRSGHRARHERHALLTWHDATGQAEEDRRGEHTPGPSWSAQVLSTYERVAGRYDRYWRRLWLLLAGRAAEKAMLEAVTRAVGSVDALPFPDGTFDIVMSAWVIETVDSPSAAVTEMLRVLRPGGLVAYSFCSRPARRRDRWRTGPTRAVVHALFAGLPSPPLPTRR